MEVLVGKWKARYVALSKTLLAVLRKYWKAYRPKTYLFTGQRPEI